MDFNPTGQIFSSLVGPCSSLTDFLSYAKTLEVWDWMVGIRRRIHEHPELGFEKFETSKIVREELNRLGMSYQHHVAVTGVVGYVGTGKAPFMALRTDMDALALQEDVEWEHSRKIAGTPRFCMGHQAILLRCLLLPLVQMQTKGLRSLRVHLLKLSLLRRI